MKKITNQGPPEKIIIVLWLIYTTIALIIMWISNNFTTLIGNYRMLEYEVFLNDGFFDYGIDYYFRYSGVLH